jgi:hypothetical protein
MSKRSRSQEKAARAERQRRRGDDAMINHLTKIESKNAAKKIKQPDVSVDAPRENPYSRLLRKLREENAAERK